MEPNDLLERLLAATTAQQVEEDLAKFEESHAAHFNWLPVGGRPNNRGPIEVSADAGRSLVERITNGIDAILEAEFELHGGMPDCRSPREAAIAWLGLPERGLSSLTTRERQRLADRLVVRISEGDGRNGRLVEVRDRGIGLTPEEMPDTILSLNESNKIQKHYLVGTYGQGGSSTFAISRFTLIASRRQGSSDVGFTVIKFLDLPPDEYKTGRYVYLSLDGSVLSCEAGPHDFEFGTLAKHFGYDLSTYSSALGPDSVYGLLQEVMFDPVMPVWLDTSVHRYRRVIKGSRSALNGAVDDGDENERGPSISHNMPMFYVFLGDFGRIGIEYWVLEQASQTNRRPTRAFLNPARPIVLSLHGQNHAELSQLLIRRSAELPFLALRLICHIDCNGLTSAAKRALFASSREDARRGTVLTLIQDELVRVLRSDDDLERLNSEARDVQRRNRDEEAVRELRREVARLLRVHGIDVGRIAGVTTERQGETGEQPSRRGGGGARHPLEPIEVREPPTFVRLVWDDGASVDFYPGQRRYLRLETDANSSYHSPNDLALSRINLIVTDQAVSLRGSTSLQGGRMRVILEAGTNAAVGTNGMFRVELLRPGLPTLSDERQTTIVTPPPAHAGRQTVTLPPFDIRPVEGPDDAQWAVLGWPDDPDLVASSAEMDEGMLVIYYSTVFPKYLAQLRRYEQRDPGLASSFTGRYEVWVATHSLLLQQDQNSATQSAGLDEPDAENLESGERAERIRLATIAALVAARETDSGSAIADAEAALDS